MLNGSFSAIVGYKFIITARNQAFFEEFVSININQRGRISMKIIECSLQVEGFSRFQRWMMKEMLLVILSSDIPKLMMILLSVLALL